MVKIQNIPNGGAESYTNPKNANHGRRRRNKVNFIACEAGLTTMTRATADS